MYDEASVQPVTPLNSQAKLADNNCPKPLGVKEVENGGVEFIEIFCELKVSSPTFKSQVISSPLSKPLSNPASEAKTGIAN